MMNQFPSSGQYWHRAASLTHTVGLLSLRQHGSGFGLLLYPTLEMLQKMIPDPTEGLTAVHEAAARHRTFVHSQAHLRRGFYKQRSLRIINKCFVSIDIGPPFSVFWELRRML